MAAITARSVGIAALAVRHNREALIETGIAPGHDDPGDPTITITAAAPGLPASTRTAGKDVHGPAGGQIAARQNYLRAAAQRFAAQLIAIAAFGRRSEEDRGQAGRRFFANFDACRTGKGIAADFTRSAIGIRGEIDIARGVELRTRDNPDRCQTAASDTAIARARSATATIAGEIDRGDGRATVDIERGLAPGAVAAIARRSRATVAMQALETHFTISPWLLLPAVIVIGLLVAGYEIGGGSGSRPLFDEDVVTELFDNASPAIVEISVALNPLGSGSGSGFFVDTDGHLVTNNHVVAGAQRIVVTLVDGEAFEAEIVGRDPQKADLILEGGEEVLSWDVPY